MATKTTFYRTAGGAVLRLTRDDAGLDLEVWRDGQWVDAPGAYGEINGTGGDGHAVPISRDQARELTSDVRAP